MRAASRLLGCDEAARGFVGDNAQPAHVFARQLAYESRGLFVSDAHHFAPALAHYRPPPFCKFAHRN